MTVRETEITVPDLDVAIAHYTDDLGYRLDMIMPADAPRLAIVSKDGVSLRLIAPHHATAPQGIPTGPIITRASATTWVKGRAGMDYRDLIPGRLGGKIIASHIRIAQGGPVPDYVHFHNIAFQMIYCRRGWVRVVYEDQGPPFVMHEGDCVLQPPQIRHRVLESSPGLEVIEIGAPAEHETWRDHDLQLPTSTHRPTRDFTGQRFVHHIAAQASWHASPDVQFDIRDTGIAAATNGAASARILRANSPAAATPTERHADGVLFLAMLKGQLRLHTEAHRVHTIAEDDAVTILPGCAFTLEPLSACEFLEVAVA